MADHFFTNRNRSVLRPDLFGVVNREGLFGAQLVDLIDDIEQILKCVEEDSSPGDGSWTALEVAIEILAFFL